MLQTAMIELLRPLGATNSSVSGLRGCGQIQAGLKTKQLPSMAKTPGREGHVNLDNSKETLAMSRRLDAELREPLSSVGKRSFHHRASGVVWAPKDSVLVRHVKTPNLDANQRAAEAERLQLHGGSDSHNLDYHYDIDVIKPRSRAALIQRNLMKP
jgi:hypothetical protein